MSIPGDGDDSDVIGIATLLAAWLANTVVDGVGMFAAEFAFGPMEPPPSVVLALCSGSSGAGVPLDSIFPPCCRWYAEVAGAR